ncbi:hypothetical protein ABIB57_004428 [Devosia sp. UYZn731]
MALPYFVVDCRDPTAKTIEVRVVADTPEQAAGLVLGETLDRGGSGARRKLRARVYLDTGTALSVVHLYEPSQTANAKKARRLRRTRHT